MLGWICTVGTPRCGIFAMLRHKSNMISSAITRFGRLVSHNLLVCRPTRFISTSFTYPEYPIKKEKMENTSQSALVVFILGGPGCGKGTQCPKIAQHFGFTHLCAGDLLEAEIKSGSKNGKMIQEFKKEGKIVPSEVTVGLLKQAMKQRKTTRFVIDGFPRNEENRTAFENIVQIEPELVLFFDCPQEELTERLLKRNQGRIDDNVNIIPKRLQVYFESTLPVINYYASIQKLIKIDARRSVDQVFEDIRKIWLFN